MNFFTPSSLPAAGSRAWPFLARLVLAIALSAATLWRPGYAIFPTLAFAAWALFLLTAVIEFPGELGLIPEPEDDPVESAEAGDDGLGGP